MSRTFKIGLFIAVSVIITTFSFSLLASGKNA